MFVLLGLWIGLLTGFAEALQLALRLYLFHEFITMSRHYVWMAPLVDGLLFALAGAALGLLHRFFPRRITPATATGVFVFLAVVALLLPFRQVHQVASLLIAAGLGVQVSRLIARRNLNPARFAGRGATGLLVVLAAIGLVFALHGRSEARKVAALPPARDGAPNILLIILDTVRAMNLGLYGYPRPTTPEIERWAAGGMVFEHVIATAPWTLPSHASMFTGKQAYELQTNWNDPLEKEPPTLAEVLSRRGYQAAGFVANARYTGWETGLSRGFSHYEDYRVTPGEMLRSAAIPAGFHKTLAPTLGLPPLRARTDGRDINAWFFRWLDQRDTTRPFFVFLNYLDAHDPYDPSRGFKERFAPGERKPRPKDGEHVTRGGAQAEMALYDAAIAYLDSVVGGMLAELKRRGLLENTVVVLASDHGEEFAEHGIMGHAASLYRPSVEVPLVISYPGRVPAGRSHGPVSLRNLAATILDVSGNRDGAIPGHSLARYWAEIDPSPADTMVSHIRTLINQPEWWPASRGDMLAVALGRYRYIRNLGDGREELFDFQNDPLELADLARTPDGQAALPGFRRILQGFTVSPSRR